VFIDTQSQKLIGFKVISGEGGIHAIRPKFDNHIPYKTIASWIGLPKGNGVWNRTAKEIYLKQGVKAFLGEFDVSHSRAAELLTDIGPTLALQDD